MFGSGQTTGFGAFGAGNAPTTSASATGYFSFPGTTSSAPMQPATGFSMTPFPTGFTAPATASPAPLLFGSTAPATTTATFTAPAFGSNTLGSLSSFGKPANAFGFASSTTATATTSSAPLQPATGFSMTPFGTSFTSPTTASSAPLFFGSSAPATASPAPVLFGSTAPATASPAPVLFGSTAPATASPAPVLFGSTAPATTNATFTAPPFGSNTLGSLSSFGKPASAFGFASSTTATATTSSVPLKPAMGFSMTSLATSSAVPATASPAPVLFGSTAPATASPAPVLFGSTAPATTTATFTAPAFGSNTLGSLSSFGKPASVTSFASSTIATATTSSVPLKPATGFSIAPLVTSSTAPTTTVTAPLSFGATAPPPPATTTTTATFTTPTLGSNTLGSLTSFGKPASVTSLASSTTATATTSSAPLKPATGFSITSLATSSAVPATTASAPVSLAVTSTAPTTAATASIPQITFGKLEDQINLWMNELTQFESDFHSQGQTINSWDSLLISNGQKLIEMKQSIEKLRSAHRGLDHQLDFIIAQQKELEQLLDQIEQNKYESGSNYVNAEREHTYSMVETVNNDLNAIGSDLKDFIKKLNETKSNQDSNDPIVQISKILNSHMDVLQWVENQIKNVKVNC